MQLILHFVTVIILNCKAVERHNQQLYCDFCLLVYTNAADLRNKKGK